MLARIQAIIMQLILEHSLRIRVKEEIPPTPIGPEEADNSESGRGAGDGAKNTPSTSQSTLLIGQINNLITADVENLSQTRDILYLVVFIPLQIMLGIAFLYFLLGWRCVTSVQPPQYIECFVVLILFKCIGRFRNNGPVGSLTRAGRAIDSTSPSREYEEDGQSCTSRI